MYYYNNTAWDVVKPDPEPPGMARWQILKQTLSELPYWRMSPCNDLALGGPGLCDAGQTRAFYVEGASITLNLRTMNGDARATWIDTWTGERNEGGTLRRGVTASRKPEAFGQAPAVLIVESAPAGRDAAALRR